MVKKGKYVDYTEFQSMYIQKQLQLQLTQKNKDFQNCLQQFRNQN